MSLSGGLRPRRKRAKRRFDLRAGRDSDRAAGCLGRAESEVSLATSTTTAASPIAATSTSCLAALTELDLWEWMKGVIPDVDRSGKPMDNAYAETFRGKVEVECINQN